MKNKIHKMSVELSNKIAAGEVVQRPASVVKELIENSLDANARNITIIIKDSGKNLIQISDDGEGMSREDALLAFERHATSKIFAIEDLEKLQTFGFRGEALSSIAAVSHVELKTRTHSSDIGTYVRIEASDVKESGKTGIEPGTTISIKNLFFNTPARRNFLKTDHTELKNITDVITRIAVAHPEAAFFYQSENDTLLDVKPKSIEGRLVDIFGERQFQSLVRIYEAHEYITIDGFIGKPDLVRKSRIEQFLFLNRRFIQNKAINHAVFEAYEHLIVRGGYPFFVLNIIINPDRFDVNVHPSKMEVKFSDESAIYRFVLSSVKKTLKERNLFPYAELSNESSDEKKGDIYQDLLMNPSSKTGSSHAKIIPFIDSRNYQETDNPFISEIKDIENVAGSYISNRDKSQQVILTHQTNENEEEQQDRPVWQIHKKYIISQIRNGVMIIDQHAAHERILYEKYFASFENNIPPSQQLLFPQTIEVTPADYVLSKELGEYLAKLGFVIKFFGKNTIVVDGVPSDVRVGDEKKILQDVLDEYRSNQQKGVIDIRDNLAKSFACKAAVKAGDKLSIHEMISVIDRLFITNMPYVCPHGRPVVIKIAMEELDKRFGRT